jgi:hypothetical protein
MVFVKKRRSERYIGTGMKKTSPIRKEVLVSIQTMPA